MLKCYLRNLEERLVAGLDRLLGFPRERRRFMRAHGYALNLRNPKSFNEKICCKKLFDRNPLVAQVADKLGMRNYVRQCLGEQSGEAVLIPLLAVLDKPEQLDLASLPDGFVIKSTHGSGNNLIVTDKSTFDRTAFLQQARQWMAADYGLRNHEWAYTQIERKLIIEALLVDEQGAIPADFKFSMIHGECAFIQVDQGRFGSFRRSLFDADWNYLDVFYKRTQGDDLPRPANLDRMVDLARQLSAPFDYIRVDFYSIGQQVYVGELTNYPARGRGRISPTEFDFKIGDRWTLPDWSNR